MPTPTRVFAITAGTQTVTLDSQGRGEVSFTVSNTGPKSITGRAKLVPIGSTKEAWLSLAAEPERNFAKGESDQVKANIAVPPGTPVGKYLVRLDVISVENPDDEFTEGPSVAFEVKEVAVAKAAPRKFPWWIVAIAAVVIVGAGVMTWLLIPKRVAKESPPAVAVATPPAVAAPTPTPPVVAAPTPTPTAVAAPTPTPTAVAAPTPTPTAMVVVPNFVKEGSTVAQAWIRLNELGLRPQYRDGEQARVSALLQPVLWQSPEGDTSVPPGTTVTYSAAPSAPQQNPLYQPRAPGGQNPLHTEQ